MKFLNNLLRRTRRIVAHDVAPAVLAGVIGLSAGVAGGMNGCAHERAREARIPLGFSEISQIEKDVIRENRIIGEGGEKDSQIGMARTIYLAGVNDLTMKVFECWNEANEEGGDVSKNFAINLAGRFDPKQKRYRYELEDLFEITQDSIRPVKEQLFNFIRIKNSLPGAITNLESAWTEDHDDQYHTEFYLETETYTDADGDLDTRIVPKTRSVYDYTDHSYWYHREQGEQAARSISGLVASIQDIRLPEQIRTASKTNPEGEQAAQKSRAKKNENVALSQEELKKIADAWYLGATMTQTEPAIYQSWRSLCNNAPSWQTASRSARDAFYRTYSHSDSGPREFQIAQETQKDCSNLVNATNKVVTSVEFTEEQLPVLRAKIGDFVESAMSTGNYISKGREVLDLTKRIYRTNYEGGFEVERFRTIVPVALTTLGLLLGAVAGGTGGSYLQKRLRNDAE